MAGAHPKHEVHGCDPGRVEAQRLVESLRVLPSRREGTYDAGRPRWGGMVGRRRCKRHARGEGQTLEAGGQGTRVLTSNMPFMAVTLDVSKLSGWLNPLSCDAPQLNPIAMLGTLNMWLMSVTPEVSQLDMSALK